MLELPRIESVDWELVGHSFRWFVVLVVSVAEISVASCCLACLDVIMCGGIYHISDMYSRNDSLGIDGFLRGN